MAEQNHIELDLDKEVAQGQYSNLAVITHSVSEFILDFAEMLPGLPKPKVVSRIILTPEHAEALKLLRGLIGRLPVETALREFNSMLEKAPTNEELISRIKVWVESMKG